jgi:hypothetical protein
MARTHHRFTTLSVVCLLFLGMAIGMPRFSPSAESSPAETRAKGQQLLQQGNFKEAWELFRQLAANPQAGSAEAAGDVQAALQSALNLGATEEVDEFLEVWSPRGPTIGGRSRPSPRRTSISITTAS